MPNYDKDLILRLDMIPALGSAQLYMCNPYIGGCGLTDWGNDNTPLNMRWRKYHRRKCHGAEK